MKTSYKIILIGIITLTPSLIFPNLLHASVQGGSSIGSELEMENILTEIVNFLTSTVALSLLIIGLIVGAGLIAVSRQNDSSGWNKIGKVIIAGVLIFGAAGVVNLFFAGAVI